MKLIGHQIEKLFNTSQTEIIIVAPFIKAPILKQILTFIKPENKIKCLTRWIPEEIITGVSDLEIWPIIESYPNAYLWLRNDLHAKYYRGDNRCLIGSANLTAKALGWSNTNNLELMIELPADHISLQQFELDLFHQCIKVDRQLYEQYLIIINQLKQQNDAINKNNLPLNLTSDISNNIWLPTLRNPEDFYLAYSGKTQQLTRVARENAIADLKFLPITPNLNQITFNAYIGILLLEKPLIQQIDNFLQTPQRFGAMCKFLTSLLSDKIPNFNPNKSWQTLMRWLLYFLPSRYGISVANYSEIFYRKL